MVHSVGRIPELKNYVTRRGGGKGISRFLSPTKGVLLIYGGRFSKGGKMGESRYLQLSDRKFTGGAFGRRGPRGELVETLGKNGTPGWKYRPVTPFEEGDGRGTRDVPLRSRKKSETKRGNDRATWYSHQ